MVASANPQRVNVRRDRKSITQAKVLPAYVSGECSGAEPGRRMKFADRGSMDPSAHRGWLRAVMLFGALYSVARIAFGALANMSASSQMRVTWRLGGDCSQGSLVPVDLRDEVEKRKGVFGFGPDRHQPADLLFRRPRSGIPVGRFLVLSKDRTDQRARNA